MHFPNNCLYPFGMIMPDRNYSAGTKYRYGFNGKEYGDNISNLESEINFGARIYDTRIARWLSTDPAELKYPFVSPYAFVLDQPIRSVDPDGKIVIVVTGNAQGFFLISGVSFSAGFAIGDDGIGLTAGAAIGMGFGLELSASVAVTIFPTMPSLNDLKGMSTGLDVGGAFGGKFGAGVTYSNGYAGITTSYGLGIGAHLDGMVGGTALAKVSWNDLARFLKGEGIAGLNNSMPDKMRLKMKNFPPKDIGRSMDFIK